MAIPFRTRFLRRDKRIMTRMHWTPMHRFFNLIILDIVKALYLINYLIESVVQSSSTEKLEVRGQKFA